MILIYFSLLNLILGSILGLALEKETLALVFWAAGFSALVFCESLKKGFHLGIIYLGVISLTLAPINTDLSNQHILHMGLSLLFCVAAPLWARRKIDPDSTIEFYKHSDYQYFSKTTIFIILASVLVAYLILPFYYQTTGAYLNWNFSLNFDGLSRLFGGMMLVGIWDELFFMSLIFVSLIRLFPFWVAAISQAFLFASFLYHLGFDSWGFFMIFIFALYQAVIFYKYRSLLLLLTIHILVDYVLYLAVIDAYYPEWFPNLFPNY